MNKTMMNTDAMKPCYPDFTNGTDNRNAVSYRQALAQFDVVNNPRYKARDNNTYCNIFLWDGSRALGCEIPHFDLFYANIDGNAVLTGHEHNANVVATWLASDEAAITGWHSIGQFNVNLNTNKGIPTVVVWNNPGGIGHVAWVLPSIGNGTRIAQAGAVNLFDAPQLSGFGNISGLRYYSHA